jgi:hypothetical protein
LLGWQRGGGGGGSGSAAQRRGVAREAGHAVGWNPVITSCNQSALILSRWEKGGKHSAGVVVKYGKVGPVWTIGVPCTGANLHAQGSNLLLEKARRKRELKPEYWSCMEDTVLGKSAEKKQR